MTLTSDEYAARDPNSLVIIPPLWQKRFDEEPYQAIWGKTRGALSTARALIVVGYSLPTTDVMSDGPPQHPKPQGFLTSCNPNATRFPHSIPPRTRLRNRELIRSAAQSCCQGAVGRFHGRALVFRGRRGGSVVFRKRPVNH